MPGLKLFLKVPPSELPCSVLPLLFCLTAAHPPRPLPSPRLNTQHLPLCRSSASTAERAQAARADDGASRPERATSGHTAFGPATPISLRIMKMVVAELSRAGLGAAPAQRPPRFFPSTGGHQDPDCSSHRSSRTAPVPSPPVAHPAPGAASSPACLPPPRMPPRSTQDTERSPGYFV